MPVYSNSTLMPNVLPGLAHRTLAGPEHGLKDLEIWSQSIFAAGDTVIIPRNEIHQIFNTGPSVLRLVAAFSMAPVRAEFPDGTRIDLPWQQAASAQAKGAFHA